MPIQIQIIVAFANIFMHFIAGKFMVPDFGQYLKRGLPRRAYAFITNRYYVAPREINRSQNDKQSSEIIVHSTKNELGNFPTFRLFNYRR